MPPTHRYAAFLRGMNLGGRRITNDELVGHVEALGFEEVAAFLASGNVVLTADSEDPASVQSRLEEGLGDALDYEVPVRLRTADEVRRIAADEPFPADVLERSGGKLQVALAADEPPADTREAVLALAPQHDRLAWSETGRELFWLPSAGVSDSELDWKAVDRLVGAVTIRTRRTVERIAAKFF